MTHATAAPARRRFGRRAVWIVLLVVALLVIGAAVAMAAAGGSGADRYRTVAAGRDAVDVTVSSAGTISPVNEADLRFPGSGTVTSVPVAVGQHVTPGQALASLDPTSLESQLASAQSTEATARARLAADKSGQASGSGSGATGAGSGAGGANAIPSGFSSGAAAQPAAAQAGAAQPPAAQPATQPGAGQPGAAAPPAGQPAQPAAAAPAAPAATPPAPDGSPSVGELQDRLLRDQHQADLDLAKAKDALDAATAACADLTPAMPAAPDTHQKPAPDRSSTAPATDPTTKPTTPSSPPPTTTEKAPEHPRDEAKDSTPAPTSAPAADPTTTAPSAPTTGEPDSTPTDTVARPASFTRPVTGHGDPDTCRTALGTVLDLQQTVGREQQAVADDEVALDKALAALAVPAQPAAPAATGAPGADAGQAAAAQAGAGQPGAGQASAGQAGAGQAGAAGAGGRAGAGAVAVPRSAGGAGASQGVSAAQLAADQAAVDSAVAQVAVAQQNLDQATMVSPIEGTVAAVNVQAGSSAPGGTTAHVVVIGAGAQEVTTTVSDLDVGTVRVGAAAEVTPGGTAAPLTGTVTTVGALNVGTAAAPAYKVTIGLAADAAAMPAGQSATISIITAHVTDVVAVPSSAVTTTGAERTVTLLEGTTPRVVPVEVGAVGPALTEITSGVAPGDRVVLADLEQPLPSLTNSGVRAVTGGGGGPPPPTGGR